MLISISIGLIFNECNMFCIQIFELFALVKDGCTYFSEKISILVTICLSSLNTVVPFFISAANSHL